MDGQDTFKCQVHGLRNYVTVSNELKKYSSIPKLLNYLHYTSVENLQ
jgi:hypothetical protein